MDKNTQVTEIVEGKKFQIKIGDKIQSSPDKDIRWTLNLNGLGWFTFTTGTIGAPKCNVGYKLKGTEGFLQKAGVLTFLKTTTQLQVWFDDTLEVT